MDELPIKPIINKAMKKPNKKEEEQVLAGLVFLTLLIAGIHWIADHWASILLILKWIGIGLLLIAILLALGMLVKIAWDYREAYRYTRSLEGRLERAQADIQAALARHSRQRSDLIKTADVIRKNRDEIPNISQKSFYRGETSINKHLLLVKMLDVRLAVLEKGKDRILTLQKELKFNRLLDQVNQKAGLIGQELEDGNELQDEIDYYLAEDVDAELDRLAASQQESLHMIDLRAAASQVRSASRPGRPRLYLKKDFGEKQTPRPDGDLDFLLEEMDLQLEKLETLRNLSPLDWDSAA